MIGGSESTVRCVNGANELNLPIAGESVGWARESLRHALNLPFFAEAFIEGRGVNPDYRLVGGDTLEFLWRVGVKGGRGDLHEATAKGLIRRHPELISIGAQVKVLGLDAEAAVDATLDLVVKFVESKYGGIPTSEAPTLAMVVEILNRIEGRLAGAPRMEGWHTDGPPLSIKQASRSANLSESHVRRAIARGELAASNVGTAGRPLWRIVRADLSRWLEAKRGGHSKLPPRSELKELIRRHLPGL